MSNTPNIVPPEVLVRVARLLGGRGLQPYNDGYILQRGRDVFLSNVDLLLAVLNKGAEMGTSRCLYVLFVLDAIEQEAVLAMTEKRQPQYAKAVLLAFSQLEPSNV